MSNAILWCDETLNPFVGCSHISPACDHCYAERMASRLANMPTARERYSRVISDAKWNGTVGVDLSVMDKARRWKKPRRIFVNSMSDTFHENVPLRTILRLFNRMQQLPRHTFVVLTKRPERMYEFCQKYCIGDANEWPSNIWAGVTVENQEWADRRIPILLRIPAKVHFISVEPILSEIKLWKCWTCKGPDAEGCFCEVDIYDSLKWVICGGETGPGARPMHPDWVRSLRDQCQEANVPFFFKGWGEWCPWEAVAHEFSPGTIPARLPGYEQITDQATGNQKRGKKFCGRLLDGREWNEFPAAHRVKMEEE